MTKPTFEESIDLVNEELHKRRARWMLSSVAWLDYEDVAQIIRFHLYIKWHLYDVSQPLKNWISRVVTNQTRNLIRNIYTNNAPICNRCAANQGGGLCAIFGQQGEECPIYKAWKNKKGEAFNVKLPVSLEHHIEEAHNIEDQSINLEMTASLLHERMKTELTTDEWEIYDLLFVQGKSEDEAARLMGYKKSNEKYRGAGYRTLFGFKKQIMEKVKQALYGDDPIDIIK